MEQIRHSEMIKNIAEDYNLNPNITLISKFNSFPILNGKRKINAFYDSIIVDNQGNEFPYMLDQHKRNEEKLIDFDYIYRVVPKSSLKLIAKEAGITLKSSSCKICEGGGWYSMGTRYEYKDTYCEV